MMLLVPVQTAIPTNADDLHCFCPECLGCDLVGESPESFSLKFQHLTQIQDCTDVTGITVPVLRSIMHLWGS